ncbi:MAG: hypothetical protein Q9201_000306 [Fulgogasparrea decipioides]
MAPVPIVHDLEQDGVEFRFVQGTHKVPPPRGYTEFFGPPPHYSFATDFSVDELERTGLSQDSEQTGDTPEDTLRSLLPVVGVDPVSKEAYAASKQGYQHDMDWLNELLDSEGPFHAVLGFSHGACVAATLLEDNIRRTRANGLPSMFKMGIFLGGVPPYNIREGGLFLADVDGVMFNLPTLHVIGSSDPLIDFALALYNLCDPETARIFDHGRGHQLIWEKNIVHDLCNVLREMIQDVM